MEVRRLLRGVMVLAIAAGVAVPAGATMLMRQSLDDLVADNEVIVMGEVLDAHSYWNRDGTFILTDVRVAVHEALKSDLAERELTITLMGGTVGDLTTLIVGGAVLIPGNSYVMFLNAEDLPSAEGVWTVRDHCQGIFDIEIVGDRLQAISQAHRHPLVPDASGSGDAPGGAGGIPLGAMMQSIRELVDRTRDSRTEVK